jgi:hypothetical protein
MADDDKIIRNRTHIANSYIYESSRIEKVIAFNVPQTRLFLKQNKPLRCCISPSGACYFNESPFMGSSDR